MKFSRPISGFITINYIRFHERTQAAHLTLSFHTASVDSCHFAVIHVESDRHPGNSSGECLLCAGADVVSSKDYVRDRPVELAVRQLFVNSGYARNNSHS